MKTLAVILSVLASTTFAQVVNPGECPAVTRNRGPCVRMCTDDGQCASGFKCCDTGCGKLCRAALFDSASIRFQQPQQQQQQLPLNGPNGQQRPNGALQQQQFRQPLNGNAVRNFAQSQLAAQPSLVGLSQCSRGATLRNPDGSTLVCGFGPRDFACPDAFSCVFDNSLRALICCPEDDSTPSSKDGVPPNPCVEGLPLTDETNKRIQCNPLGGASSGCPSGTSCNAGACCPLSVAGFLSVKEGVCPMPHPMSPGGNCPNQCSFDSDCLGDTKCCFTGCGARCVNVLEPQTPPQQSAPGFGPPGSNARFQAQLDAQRGNLVPTRNDGVFFNGNNNNNFAGRRNPIGPPGFGPQPASPQQRSFAPQQQQQRARQPSPQFGAAPLPSLKDFPAKSDSETPVAAVKTNVRPGVSLGQSESEQR